MAKKWLTIISGFISIVLIILNKIGMFKLCGSIKYGSCMDIIFSIMVVLFPIVPLFIFSLITYKMRENIYTAWWKFARIWIPLSMLAILVSPSTGNWMIPIEKGSVAFVSMCAFTIISVFLIIVKYIQERKK